MLQLSGVSVAFGTHRALRGVDLRVGGGELVALSGEPGAGKTALVRCVSGDTFPDDGRVTIDGEPLTGGLRVAERAGVAVVWQDLTLCENLDVAGNLLLGRETRSGLFSPARFHRRAAELLADLRIPIPDTTALASSLPGGQRRLLALAMALTRRPRLLVLDEPTLALGARETAAVERLLLRARRDGIAVLITSRDIAQMFRIADRIVILRQGRIAADLPCGESHPDEVAGLLAGGVPGGSARRQLTRLHGLADSLARADPSSGLALVLAGLAAAIGLERGAITIRDADIAAIGGEMPDAVRVDGRIWQLPVRAATAPGHPSRVSAVIELDHGSEVAPSADELNLMALYAGYAGAAIERREAELAQREASALRRSRELQRQFLSRLSHELRTPLTAIRGYATSLAAPDVTWDAESERRFLERIGAESARLGRLVDDLLDFSAIESGVLRLHHDWCELRLVADAAAACLPADRVDCVRIVGDPPSIWADHDRLEQVLVNLAGNALRHNPDGTRVTIGMHAVRPGWVELTVSDDGSGLPAGVRGTPFEQAGRPRSATAGAGLGLSITRGIVVAHGGTIAVESSDDGTCFRIELPVEAPPVAAEPALSGAGAR